MHSICSPSPIPQYQQKPNSKISCRMFVPFVIRTPKHTIISLRFVFRNGFSRDHPNPSIILYFHPKTSLFRFRNRFSCGVQIPQFFDIFIKKNYDLFFGGKLLLVHSICYISPIPQYSVAPVPTACPRLWSLSFVCFWWWMSYVKKNSVLFKRNSKNRPFAIFPKTLNFRGLMQW